LETWKPAAEQVQVQLLRLRKSLGSLEQGDEEVQVQLLGVQIILGKLEESR
jgi:hypothetical protein